MSFPWSRFIRGLVATILAIIALPGLLPAQSSPSSAKPSAKQVKTPAPVPDSTLDAGAITDGVYRNKTLALSCNIPPGWILRTDEMNARDEETKTEEPKAEESKEDKQGKEDKPDHAQARAASSAGAKVLLAAFSRPPEAKGEDVNSSILIAAENASSYPGLKEAAQYFGPLIEVARAQGFNLDEDPYDIAIGTKTLVRGDFHKNVGSRVMRQSTLTMLAHGYAISITIIGGTDDEVEDLVDGLSFSASAGGAPRK
jgi:hypothetical protein